MMTWRGQVSHEVFNAVAVFFFLSGFLAVTSLTHKLTAAITRRAG